MTATITITAAEADCREFATHFPTPNVLRAIELAQAGRVSWFAIYDLFRSATTAGLRAG